MFNFAVLVNTAAVLVGSVLGLITGKGIPERFKQVLFQAIGLLTIGLGAEMFLDANSALVVLGSLALGGLLGEALGIEEWLAKLADTVGPGQGADFARGFVMAATLFLTGPMTIIGSIQAGLEDTGQLLLIKSLMDGISAMMLAATYGAGVLLSAVAVFLVQGLLVTFASSLSFLQGVQYLGDFTAVGGLMVIGIGVRMLELRDIKVGNYLPALVVSPLLSFLIG